MLGTGAGRARWWWLGVASLALASVAEAGAYRYVDPTGNVHYTDTPADSRYRPVPGWRESSARVTLPAPSVARARASLPYLELIRSTAERHRVDHRLVEAVVTVESGGNPRAVSRKGAQGLMQLMPQRAVLLGVKNPFDPGQNVDGGVRHLRDLLQRFGGDVTLAVAAYNAGEEAVRSHQGVPPFEETQDYVRRIRALYYGLDGPGPRWAVGQAPQQVYRQVNPDGSVLFTNVPPRPLRRGL
jgi:soluble lytic murein transglycosylase-like protein